MHIEIKPVRICQINFFIYVEINVSCIDQYETTTDSTWYRRGLFRVCDIGIAERHKSSQVEHATAFKLISQVA